MNKVTIENYEKLREELKLENQKLTGNILNEDELKANEILSQYIKDFKNQFDDVPYRMPVLREPKIWNSKLYDFCMNLPKGSDLHVHGTSLLPMDKLIEFIKNNNKLFIGLDDFVLSLNKDDKHVSLKYALDNNLIDYNELFRKWTILGRDHKVNRWSYFENLFSYFEAIDNVPDIIYEYYLIAFEYYISLNISHVEIHLLIDNQYDVAFNMVNAIKDAYINVKRKYPFFTVRIICGGMKDYYFDLKDGISRLNNTYKIMNEIKDDFDKNNINDFIVGFDLVNEEDKSRPLKNYAPALLEFVKDKPNFDFYLHSGESLDPDTDNLIDAYLLNAKRVGHGFNLYHYPKLMDKYINSEICLEVCPISNQTLGYTTNIRNHPFIEYIKRGVTLSLCSDDPIFMEHNSLVDDFFAVIVCFELNISDIKQLCINSIMYSSLDSQSKTNLMKHWKEEYNSFITKLIK